jgi:hypothetical protein
MLPKWAKDNRTAVLEEAADYVGLTQEQRTEILQRVMRVAALQLAGRADRAALFEFRDPLPKSSIDLLARLRREYEANGGRAS